MLVLDVTAKTQDGKEIFRESKIYMPQATDNRSDAMLYGAQYKMGLIADTTLQPGQTRVEKYEIPFPFEKTDKTLDIKAKEMDVTVELRYQPGAAPGVLGKGHFIFYKDTRKVSIQ
jgi:hypothetical protein